jgi:hypothetical protein
VPHLIVRQKIRNTTTMNTRSLVLAVLATLPSAYGAIVNVSFQAYDQSAQNTPYYSHYGVTSDLGVPGWYGAGDADSEVVAIVNLMDSGWGFSASSTSSFHVMTRIDAARNSPRPLRSIGWHQFSFVFDTNIQTMSILMNGTEIQNGTFTNPITWFMFAYNGGSGRETVIDDFSVTWDGNLVYEQGFNSSTLDPAWAVTRIDSGGYATSGDTSNPFSGAGALALGGNVSGIAFDLTSVPEPTTTILSALGLASFCMIRRRI